VSSDQRVHARIHVSTKIDVVSTSGTKVEAELRDLSKGGARFDAPAPLGQVGETIELYLPSLTGSEITVSAQIIRQQMTPGGQHTFAVRFDQVEEEKREQLVELIEVLLQASGGGRRGHARAARRIEIRFGQLEDLRVILEDITAGGLLMTVNEPLVLYEEVDLTVPDLSGAELIILHARVVNQRGIPREGGQVYRVGLEFIGLRPETKRVLGALLESVREAIGPVIEPPPPPVEGATELTPILEPSEPVVAPRAADPQEPGGEPPPGA
jgi:c-di-GMP-binding flagellar brake protein YcgR